MATKSILKTVTIRDRKSALALANALEQTRSRKKGNVKPTSTYRDMSKADIRKVFGVK